MDSLTEYALKQKYAKVKKLRPKLGEVNNLVNWNKFGKFIPRNDQAGPGRPAYDVVLMLKILFLQAWHGISDEEIEFQINDRLSFQQFLGFPKNIPDYSTIWRFREELTKKNKIEKIWKEMNRQLGNFKLEVKEGYIQDATFIEADPGKTNSGMQGRGDEAKTSRNRDGSWSKKGKKSHFGYKLHTKVQKGSKLIKDIAVTTAKTHDGRVDLSNPGEIVYRDRGYTGIKCKALGDGTMKRGKLSVKDKLRNLRIQKQRAEGEHPFGTMKRSFHGGRTKLTTLARVHVQQVFVCAAYNFHRVRYLLLA